MTYYVVGRDWPDNFYATNAKWPAPNQWWRNPDRHANESLTAKFRASQVEMKKAREIEEREAARKESRKLKKQLFQAIVQVCYTGSALCGIFLRLQSHTCVLHPSIKS